MRLLIVAVLTLLALTPLFAQENPVDSTTRETIEWLILRWEQTGDQKLPRVLLIGDSISNGYHGEVSKLLKGKANVDLLATSKSICDPAFLREVELATADYTYAVIHFNNGLHGWHLDEGQYEAGLRRLVALLQRLEPGAKLIWASSTPVVVMGQGPDPNKNPTVIKRNEVAARVMAEAHVPVDDLYAVVVEHTDWHSDAYHYAPQGKAAQAEAVVKAVTPLLPTAP